MFQELPCFLMCFLSCFHGMHMFFFSFFHSPLSFYVYVFGSLEKSQDRMMKELHSNGKTMEDIAEVLKRIPIHPQVISAIKAAHALG